MNDHFNQYETVFNEFPDLSKSHESQKYNAKNEIKFSNKNYNQFPKNIKLFIDFLNSNIFLDFLQNLTSIKEKLISDPHLEGGGLHEIKKGGVLKIHTDFNRHPFLDLDRRVNVLIYLNKNWKASYGGNLELWNKKEKRREHMVAPIMNRAVIFTLSDDSVHGHPAPLNCPEGFERYSIAMYYFVDEPKQEYYERTYVHWHNELQSH